MNINVTTNVQRIGQEGPDIPPPYPKENYHLHTNENFRSKNTTLLDNDQTRSRQLRTHQIHIQYNQYTNKHNKSTITLIEQALYDLTVHT